MAVADAVKARLAKIQPTLPADIKIEVIRDQSRFIKGSIEEVKFHLVLAAVLVIADDPPVHPRLADDADRRDWRCRPASSARSRSWT